MNVEANAVHYDPPVQDREFRDSADAHQAGPRIEHQPPRAHHQQEAQVPPAIAPGTQMRATRSSMRREYRRYLHDAPAGERRLHDHLAGELHARRSQTESQQFAALSATQTAMEVADPGGEEQSSHEA